MKIYLHIGVGKCASSSIQSFFSKNFKQDTFAYACLNKDGTIDTGRKLRVQAQNIASDYRKSCSLEGIDRLFLANFELSLTKLSSSYQSILFSNELWIESEEQFSYLSSVLSKYTVEVIMVVRPPVLWMNSAWWQWGRWSGISEDEYVSKNVSKQWLNAYNFYNSLPYINKVHVLSLSDNVMDSVFRIVGFNGSNLPVPKSNQASSQELLTFMTDNRELRTGVHNAAKELILNKHLKSRTKANWVLSKSNIESLLEKTRESNVELSRLIVNENICENSAWWDSSFYKDRVMERNHQIDHSTLNSMLLEAYQLIIRLHHQKSTPIPKYLKSEALRLEKENIRLAYDLINLAYDLNPTNPSIKCKVQEYHEKLNRTSLLSRLKRLLCFKR
ncbi:hypothetical protein [Vibrio breoganii]|uniref:hypothetical protein n=1 Tax=Vibrio breoganii TaxID=553239 RepID=UPI00105600EC|nr:hypothetical protein [Vibrio breoganii]